MRMQRAVFGGILLSAFSGMASAQVPDVPCGWPVVSDPDTVNVAYPDEAAIYWLTEVPSVPGTRLRIEGRVPDARYFSFHSYDSAQRPIDGIADYEITPVGDSGDPSRRPASAPGTAYEIYVSREGLKTPRDPNTLYAGDMPVGSARVPNPRINLIYRVYVPADGKYPDGGVDLPRVILETDDGATTILEFGECGPLNPSTGNAVNEAIRESDAPDAASLVPYPFATSPPGFARFYGLPDTARRLASAVTYNLTGQPVPKSSATEGSGGGFFSNVHNAYLTGSFSRNFGNLYVVRAKAPTFEDDSRLAPGAAPQLRYWSICTNDFPTQRFVGCLTDYQAEIGPDGWLTLIVSDAGDRPSETTAGSGINWLPWGGVYVDSLLIYRHMLPAVGDDGFAEAIQNVGYYQELEAVMGDYAPRATYCDAATVDAALAAEPANPGLAVYDACTAS